MKKSLLLLLLSVFAFNAFTQDTLSTKPQRQAQFRVAGDLGLHYRFGSTEGLDPQFFYQDLKTGAFKQLSIDYGQMGKVNIGLVFNQWGNQKFLPNVDFVDSLGNPSTGTLGEEFRVRSFLARISGRRYLGDGENVALLSGLGVGINSYSATSTRAESIINVKGSSLTAALFLGLDIFLSPKFALGAETRLFFSSVSQLEVDNGIEVVDIQLNEAEKINLSKLEVGIGCRYYF